MIEVEAKAHVNDFNSVLKKLNEIGAEEVKIEHQKDTYFNNLEYRDFEKSDEALRIRNTTLNDGTSQIILTYKGPKLDDISKTRKEIEVSVEDAKNTGLILESLGFKPAANVEKERTTYLFEEFIISLDKVHKVGNFVEIEKGMIEGEDFKEAIDKIFEIYKKLGIEEGFERRSYLELMGVYKS
jgi:adenylate cyclase class 2